MAFINPNLEGSHYHADGLEVICDLCPHHCRIKPEHFGLCRSRKNHEGKLVAYNYGRVSTMAVDPIEKKPLYHFHPGSSIFSLGSIGCNMHCDYCQNYSISMSPIGKKRTTYKSPADIVAFCRQQGYHQIAFTYNEPIIWYEYIRDIMDLDPELEVVLVSNGMASEDPLDKLCEGISAANIDVKSFNDDFYKRICGGKLDSVKTACETIYENNIHLELTYLVIPGYNDSPEEVRQFSKWVQEHLDPEIPVHFTRFHPDNKMMDVRLTPVDTLLNMKSTAEGCGLKHVYVGNVLTDDGSNTYCPECGQLLIRRMGFKVDILGLEGNRCSLCKHRTNIIR